MKRIEGFSFTIRIVHMLSFELFALILFSPLSAFVLRRGLFEIASFGVMSSVMAILWNFIYNYVFDNVERKLGKNRFKRSITLRILHALLFELGLLIATLPLVAFWLDMTLLQAFIVDIIFVIFFLLYAFVYNWLFDLVYLAFTNQKNTQQYYKKIDT